MNDKDFIDWHKQYREEHPEYSTDQANFNAVSAAFEAGRQIGLKQSPEHARGIVADLLCLLVDFKDKIIFDDEINKIKAAEDFLK